ncbi:MAG TPA: hypothetical protein VE646_01565 [Actinomycetota bacterium]|jgi:O-antigen/teichoic acid export membrane protein|nr:hypothetical protein [Actinomycetota bacterium]
MRGGIVLAVLGLMAVLWATVARPGATGGTVLLIGYLLLVTVYFIGYRWAWPRWRDRHAKRVAGR